MSINSEPPGSNRLGNDLLRLEVADHPSQKRVVQASGEIDTMTAPLLSAYLHDQLVDAQTLILDLSGVDFLGSAGLAVLVEIKKASDAEDRSFRLVCGSRVVTRALQATGLDELFDIAANVPAALQGG